MSKWDKLLERILSDAADANIDFDDLCRLLERQKMQGRMQGSHRVLMHPALNRPLVIQPRRDGKAKSYQMEQVRAALRKINEYEANKDMS